MRMWQQHTGLIPPNTHHFPSPLFWTPLHVCLHWSTNTKKRCDYNNDIFLNKVTAKKHTRTLDTRLPNHSSSGYCSYLLPHTHSSSSTTRLALHISETMMVGSNFLVKHAATTGNVWILFGWNVTTWTFGALPHFVHLCSSLWILL